MRLSISRKLMNIRCFAVNWIALNTLLFATPADANDDFQQWLQQQTTAIESQKKEFQEFKDKRDKNIHQEPIIPDQVTSINETISVSDSIVAILENTVTGEKEIISSTSPQIPENKTTISHSYKFSDWSGPEDIVDLCEKYISELEGFINSGKGQFISG